MFGRIDHQFEAFRFGLQVIPETDAERRELLVDLLKSLFLLRIESGSAANEFFVNPFGQAPLFRVGDALLAGGIDAVDAGKQSFVLIDAVVMGCDFWCDLQLDLSQFVVAVGRYYLAKY